MDLGLVVLLKGLGLRVLGPPTLDGSFRKCWIPVLGVPATRIMVHGVLCWGLPVVPASGWVSVLWDSMFAVTYGPK